MISSFEASRWAIHAALLGATDQAIVILVLSLSHLNWSHCLICSSCGPTLLVLLCGSATSTRRTKEKLLEEAEEMHQRKRSFFNILDRKMGMVQFEYSFLNKIIYTNLPIVYRRCIKPSESLQVDPHSYIYLRFPFTTVPFIKGVGYIKPINKATIPFMALEHQVTGIYNYHK